MLARRIVAVETMAFNGHRCGACGWICPLSHTVRSVKLANREAKEAFKAHACINYRGINLRQHTNDTARLPEFFRKILEL
jgi:hypothetical protein